MRARHGGATTVTAAALACHRRAIRERGWGWEGPHPKVRAEAERMLSGFRWMVVSTFSSGLDMMSPGDDDKR